MFWRLAWFVILGALPGIFIGAWIRVVYLPDPVHFKLFAGSLLMYIGARLAKDAVRSGRQAAASEAARYSDTKVCRAVTMDRFSLWCTSYMFEGRMQRFSAAGVIALCLPVGIAGGAYGIGGGAIIAPFLVAVFGIPVRVVAGAALMATFITSVAGVAFYQILAEFYPQEAVTPDYLLGMLFGIGGLFGMYSGARIQKHVPARTIKLILSGCVLFVAVHYIAGFFF